MNTQQIKTRLIETIGERPTAFLQALRFIYLLYTKQDTDPEIALLPKLLNKGDTAVDVGANGANWTYWLHGIVGRTGSVYAFEADPYYAAATDLTIRLMRLKGVRLFPYGLSDVEEKVKLQVNDSGGLRLTGKSRIDRNANENSIGAKSVEVRRLDSLIYDFPKLVTTRLIKCDVEGYELFVFRGAVDIIERSRPVIILETGNFEIQGYGSRDVYDFFDCREYVSFALIGDNTLAKTNNAFEHGKAITVNRVLIPKEQQRSIQDEIVLLNY